MKKNLFIVLLFSLNTVLGINVDSLKSILPNAKSVQIRIEVLNQLGDYYESTSNYSEALVYLREAEILNKNHKFNSESVKTYNLIGYVYWHQSLYDSTFKYHKMAIKVAEFYNVEDVNYGFSFLLLGDDYYDIGDFEKSSSFFFKSLRVAEKIGSNSLRIKCYNRLGKLFYKLKYYSRSIEYVKKAVLLNNNSDFRELGKSTNNFGNIYLAKNNIDSAMFYFTKTLEYFTKSGDLIGQSIACINLGDTYFKKFKTNFNTLDSSFLYYQKSLKINTLLKNQYGKIYGLIGMADVLLLMEERENSISYYKKALAIAIRIGASKEKENLYYKIYTFYKTTNKSDSSLYYLQKYAVLDAENVNYEYSKKLLDQESSYLTEKEILYQNVEKEKRSVIIIAVVSIVLILILFIAFIFNRLKVARKQNSIIESQSEVLLQKSKLIDSNIESASKIQSLILPSSIELNKISKDSFVLYKPKDTVAGDFYWVASSSVPQKGGETPFLVDDDSLFAVADCTGHGVRGAMMSMICNNALNRSIKEFSLSDPGEILTKTRELIIEEDMEDGMDIALCNLVRSSAKEKGVGYLQYAGAFNPLWIIRNNEIIEVEADRQPVSKYHKYVPFTTHTIDLFKNDFIFLFSDGYMDQFGGDNDEKFGRTRFKELLLSIQDKSVEEQERVIELTLDNWMRKSGSVQIDDVCVMGVKV